MSDLFADLLKGASSDNSSKKMESNLSLNEKMSASSTVSNVNGNNGSNLDLDFLDTYMKKSTSTVDASKNSTNLDVNDLLFSQMNISRKTQSPTDTKPTSKPTQQASMETDLLDDFFGHSVPSKTTNANLSDSSSFVQQTSSNKSNLSSIQEKRDGVLAELLDMGFPIDKALKALEATETGYDLDSAISYLMKAAHSSTRHTSPPSKAFNARESDIVNDISSNIMSTASFLFNSGKKKIQQGVEMYRKQTIENNQGKPLWMKNQQQYKANSMTLSNWNEEEDEMDEETMRKLLEQQRERERRFKQKAGSFDNEAELRRPQNNVEASRQSFKSSPTDEITYVSKARRGTRTRKFNTETSTESVPSGTTETNRSQQIQHTEDIDLLNGFSSSAPQNSSTFNVASLDSAQNMAFTHAREIAQENFKTGDFTKSLEFYIEAGNVIPNDHPYQIIICSNLSVLYSKLGNAKEQLSCADRGLNLIVDVMNEQRIGVADLTNLKIEDGKNLKSFWSKLMLKKAESLEHLEKWSESKLAYETLIKNGESSKTVMEGKNRCNKVLNPQTEKPKLKNASKISQNKPNVTSTASEKLQRVKQFGDQKKREEEEKFHLHDKVESKLEAWRRGNEDNIRALICSLDKILWPELNWKPVALTDLVMDNKVKINYMKAVAKTHPDKISASESTENKMIANGVFITLNEAWERFKASKNL